MNMMTSGTAAESHPLEFTGKSLSFFWLVLGNLFLTIVTIGIYRFWGKTRVRGYLWESTRFQGEALEYRGRGIEKFIGALIVAAVVFLPLFIVSLIAAALGGPQNPLAILLYLLLYVGLFFLLGVGIYRSQRYMFSRTSWRGIRGGMRGDGWSYGLLYLGLLLLQVVTLGFAAPYATVRLWNTRMNDAMFGSLAVTATAEWRPLFKRFAIVWAGAIVIYLGVAATLFLAMPEALAALKPGAPPPADPSAVLAALGKLYGLVLLAGVAIGLLFLSYSAALLRELFGQTRIGPVALHMSVTTGGLFRFYLGNIALVVFTFGIGLLIMPYRIFGFYARRLSTIGHLDGDALLQTQLAGPSQGDGLADAFDVSAF